MKFLKELDSEDIISVVDVMSVSMLFYNDIKHKHILADVSIIDNLATAVVDLVTHNQHVKNTKELAMMQIGDNELVKKVERNGKVFGLILGGRE